MSVETVKDFANELNYLLDDYIINTGMFVPVKKNVIKYKKYSITKTTDDCWAVSLNGTPVITTFLKLSAFAICKLHEINSAGMRTVIEYDEIFERNYIDSNYYKRTIAESSDKMKIEAARCRYDMSKMKAQQARTKINYLFKSSFL